MKTALRRFYFEHRITIFHAFVIAAILVCAGAVLYPYLVELWKLLHDKNGNLDISAAGKVFAGCATIAGGIFALWRWTVDQHWRRIQYAQQLVKEFFANENTKLALRMLDVQGDIELPPAEKGGKLWRSVDVTEELLIGSLLTFDQQEDFDEPELSVRLIFDQFFTDLSMFQHHVDAKLIKLRDIRPYLAYWIKGMNGHGSIYTIKAAKQINVFLQAFDYDAVLRLSHSMGYLPKTISLSVDEKIENNTELTAYFRSTDNAWLKNCRTAEKAWLRKNRIDEKNRRLFSGFPNKRFPIYERSYELRTVVNERYCSIIRSDYEDTGNGTQPSCGVETILWDKVANKKTDIRPFFTETSDSGAAMKEILEAIIASLNTEKKKYDTSETATAEWYKDLKPTLLDIGAVTLAPSTTSGKSSGLTFHYPPAAVGPYDEGEYVAFVSWRKLKPYLTPEGASIFAGARPKGDDDGQQ